MFSRKITSKIKMGTNCCWEKFLTTQQIKSFVDIWGIHYVWRKLHSSSCSLLAICQFQIHKSLRVAFKMNSQSGLLSLYTEMITQHIFTKKIKASVSRESLISWPFKCTWAKTEERRLYKQFIAHIIIVYPKFVI